MLNNLLCATYILWGSYDNVITVPFLRTIKLCDYNYGTTDYYYYRSVPIFKVYKRLPRVY